MGNAASDRAPVHARAEDRTGAWIAAGPVAVVAAWLALVFVPVDYRLQVLYASIALLSVAVFAVAFHLSARTELGRAPRARPERGADASVPERRDVPAAVEPSAAREAEGGLGIADESDARFRLVVEAAPNAMIMIDAEGAIQLLNSQAERLFGYERAQLLGQSIEVLLPSGSRAMHRAVRGAYMKAPETRRMGAGRDLFGLRRDGVQVRVDPSGGRAWWV